MDINIEDPEIQEAIARDNNNKTGLHLHVASHSQDGMAFAASSATEEEQKLAKLGRQPDGSTAVKVAKRPWRPKVKFTYEEPEEELDTSDDIDWMHEECGHALTTKTTKLPPRNDLILYNDQQDNKELQESVQWRDCPQWIKPIMEDIIKMFWDSFAKEGMKRPIRGYEFVIDTGTRQPFSCRIPVYGPHESRVILKLAKELENKGLIEDDDGPWGSPVVLASKPNQEHVHWSQYVFRLCVSYRALNAVTRPFLFPVKRCDEAVELIGEAKYVITMDLDAGYWQMFLNKQSRSKTAFYIPRGKKRWKRTPMGATNAHPAFVAMMMQMEDEWNDKYEAERRDKTNAKAIIEMMQHHFNNRKQQTIKGNNNCCDNENENWNPERTEPAWTREEEPAPKSAVIVDDVILAAVNATTLLYYYTCVLSVLQFYRVTVKLRKSRFFPKRAEFVGLDVLNEGNSPARSKNEAIMNLERPRLFTDLRMLVGTIGFYRDWIPLYETRISPWRRILKLQPAPGTATKEEEESLLTRLWNQNLREQGETGQEYKLTNDEHLDALKKAILEGPILKRPNPNRRYYLKSDWSKWAQGAVLLQADITEEAEIAMLKEMHGATCEFDKKISGLRLRPIKFISTQRATPSSRHSFVGEASTGRWAFLKFKRYLIGQEFTWITDCSGLRKFFETEYEATHTLQRWKLELLRFDFTIVHRPGKMLTECDMLSRYNTWTDLWRQQEEPKQEKGIASTMLSYRDYRSKLDRKAGVDSTNTTNHYREEPRPLPFSNLNPQLTGKATAPHKSMLAEICDKTRTCWIMNRELETAKAAGENVGINIQVLHSTTEKPEWQSKNDIASATTFATRRLKEPLQEQEKVQWILILNWQGEDILPALKEAKKRLAKAIIFLWTNMKPGEKGAEIAESVWPEWEKVWLQAQNSELEGPIEATTNICILADEPTCKELRSKEKPTEKSPIPMETILDMNDGNYQDCSRNQTPIPVPEHLKGNAFYAKVKGAVQTIERGEQERVYDITHPLPCLKDGTNIRIPATDGVTNGATRLVRMHEMEKALGLNPTQHKEQQLIKTALTLTTPIHTWEFLLSSLYTAEERSQAARIRNLYQESDGEEERGKTLVTKMVNRWTTLAEPTVQEWRQATKTDSDLKEIYNCLENGTRLDKAKLTNKGYYDQWAKGRLEAEDELIYQYEEPKVTRIRQLRRRVVPRNLRSTIIAAYHATPLAGHTGIYKTYWRIAARFYWPGMYKDVRNAVNSCAHCNVANATSHQEQQIFSGIPVDEPFDIIGIDIWFPGKTTTDIKQVKNLKEHRAVLNCMDTLTGFISSAFMSWVDSESAAKLAFSHFFIPNGIPKLILLDGDSAFKGVLVQMCTILGVRYRVVPPEAHNAVMIEGYHRFLNKIQRIHQANTRSYENWKLGMLFAAYAWNASPVDGLDVIRSFAAKARTFRFPLDIGQEDGIETVIPEEGEDTLDHLETMFPLWYRQKEMLKILNLERRRRHRDLANAGKNKRTFKPGDIVIVRKQIKSKEGKPAKLTLRARGPYRVLRPEGENTYVIQKIPWVQSLTRRPGKELKELAWRLTKIPSTVVVHKRVNTADTKLVEQTSGWANSPMEKNLAIYDFGRYAKAPPNEDFAFVKVNEMWDEELQASESEEESEPEEQDEIPEQPQTRLQRKRLREKQEKSNTTTTVSQAKRSKSIRQESNDKTKTTKQKSNNKTETKRYLEMLYNEIAASTDKLFIIAKKEPGKRMKDWHIVQIDWEETNHSRAKRIGEYHTKFYIRNAKDSTTRLSTNCNYWPLIRELDQHGYFRAIVMVRPNKVENYLNKYPETRRWYQLETNIAEDGIIGPFNFTSINGEPYRIPNKIWKELENEIKAEQLEIDITDLRKVNPLK